ncbi:MAG: CHAP domain-containing protein [Epsilonproteobacteria bacterium]|nr:CHAP domain-containing protein [Campylobacterota bacterium]
MKNVNKAIISSVLVFGLLGCGNEASSSEKSSMKTMVLPTIASSSESLGQQKVTQAEIDVIKNSVHELSWAYYQEERTAIQKDRRWYISMPSAAYVFSLMPIVNGQAGWAGISLNAGSIDLNNNTVSIADMSSRSSCSYYDYGLAKSNENCIIQTDVELIRNSTVPIKWWFFQASNNNWYIMTEGYSVAFMFAGNEETGDYDWSHTVDIGVKPTFFVEDGVKKLKFVSSSTDNQLIGIDVSKHNGYINWEAVKNDGVSFAFIKATEGYPETSYEKSHQYSGNFLDTKFENNMDGALEQNLLIAPYHFIRVDYNEKTSDAVEEAKYFLRKIKPYYESHKLLPPVIDIENPPSDKENPLNKNQIGRWSKLEFTNWIRSFAYEVEHQLGVKPILYMNEYFSNSEVESNLFDTYELWIAKYMFGSENGTVINSLDDLENHDVNFKPNRDYLFWQFTETAMDIDGVSNYVDKNIFQGTLEDLQIYLVNPPTTNAKLTYMSPSGTPVKKSNQILNLYGENLKNVAKVFIAGVDITNFTVYEENKIKIETTERHGGNLAYDVPFGYRDVIVKFIDGSRIILRDGINIMEPDLATGSYPETVLLNKDLDIPYARGANAFSATSHGQDLLGQCTWYVYGRFVELVDANLLSPKVYENIKNAFWNKYNRDAKNWSSLLGIKDKGISTATTALPLDKRKKGLLAVWECGTHGHVGFVEEVGGDNKEWYILSDYNRGLNTKYKKQKYRFDSSQTIAGAVDDKVGSCYPTFYNLSDISW